MASSALRSRIAVIFSVAALVAVPLSSSASDEPAALDAPAAPHESGACVPQEKCCKVCSAGKACGNSCISAAKSCHKGRGCACNDSEICGSGG